MLHPAPPWKEAVGKPKSAIFKMESLFVRVAGISSRGKNHTLIQFEVHSVAYIPGEISALILPHELEF
jgi:Cys-tRNA synthase (O-phospho-L-seryl-tRNA:Cys-tRNA synthase)